MQATFRLTAPTESETVVSLMREYYAYDHLAFDEDMARTAVKNFLVDESLGRVWLILYGDEMIGYLVMTLGYSLEYGGRDAFIDEVYIRDTYRGRGIGTRALAFAEETCRSLGVRALHLEVERANVNAYGVYRKAGFVDHERYLMTKHLSQASASERSPSK